MWCGAYERISYLGNEARELVEHLASHLIRHGFVLVRCSSPGGYAQIDAMKRLCDSL